MTKEFACFMVNAPVRNGYAVINLQIFAVECKNEAELRIIAVFMLGDECSISCYRLSTSCVMTMF